MDICISSIIIRSSTAVVSCLASFCSLNMEEKRKEKK